MFYFDKFYFASEYSISDSSIMMSHKKLNRSKTYANMACFFWLRMFFFILTNAIWGQSTYNDVIHF